MFSGLVMSGSGEVGAIVWTPEPEMLNATLSDTAGVAFASVIACRSEPAPPLFVS